MSAKVRFTAEAIESLFQVDDEREAPALRLQDAGHDVGAVDVEALRGFGEFGAAEGVEDAALPLAESLDGKIS